MPGRVPVGRIPVSSPGRWLVWTAALWASSIAVANSMAGDEGTWKTATIPQAWRQAAAGRSGRNGFRAWYRCGVFVPQSWRAQPLSLFVEGVDDAREVYVNGRLIGRLGKFPPAFRSGLGKSQRMAVPPDVVRWGATNVVAIRVCHRDGRLGFNVAAPVLFASQQAIRLNGTWQVRSGDDTAWAELAELPTSVVFRRVEPRETAEKTLRQLADDSGPFSPQITRQKLQSPDDLVIEVVLAEPVVAQPLSVKFDERGRLWLMEYRQYPNPAGLRPVSRDKYLRTVYDKMPLPPPRHTRGHDRISIHEDTDGDGRYDRHTIFVDGLNIATSFARGRGGVWVLNPPYLLFYPDRDGDDRPDGPPEVHLEGFGLEDTHSVVNSLTWGPDGWLYGAQGSTVSGHVRRPASDAPPVQTMGQLIWRYHPERHVYEVFAEGGGNAYGLEIDAKGRIFSGHNGGNTRGFHYVQGGYFQKGFGKHGALSNPYAYGYLRYMPHPNVPRFTHDFTVYEGAALPTRYDGRIFAVAPLQGKVLISARQPVGSTFRTVDEGEALSSGDTWVRPVEITFGPDGALYVCDFYEQRIDHAAHFQGRVDPTNGRVYRIRGRDAKRPAPFDLGRASSESLLQWLEHPNRWFRFTALRILADRRDVRIAPQLAERLFDTTGTHCLEYLWALHLTGGLGKHGLSEQRVLRALGHPDPYVRLWTIRLACDARSVAPSIARRLAELARSEPNIEVRNQLGCSARRLATPAALPIFAGLARHDKDIDDPYQPLTLWWLLERQLTSDRNAVLDLFHNDRALWNEPLVERFLLERIMRRLVQPGQRRGYLDAARWLEAAPDRARAARLMRGFEQAMQGRSLVGLPRQLVKAIARAGGLSLELRMRQADPKAIAEALRRLASPRTPSTKAVRLIEIIGELHPESAQPVLLDVVQGKAAGGTLDTARRRAAVTALEQYDGEEIARVVLSLLPSAPSELREAAFGLLASRPEWTAATLRQVAAGTIAKSSVADRFVRRALLHRDARVVAEVKRIFGPIEGATTKAMYAQITQLKQTILDSDGNPYAGKELFAQHCGKCHRLFDEGGHIGPDLTPFQRSDLDRVLLNVVNPSAEIREGFESYVVYTEDGRALTGFIEDQDDQIVILKDAEGNRHTLPRAEIEEMRQQKRSVMPERLLDSLTPIQVRDLFAYLRMSQPLP